MAALVTFLFTTPLFAGCEYEIFANSGLVGVGLAMVMFIVGAFWLAINACAYFIGY